MKYMIGNRTFASKTEDVSAALDTAQIVSWSSQIDDGETAFIFAQESSFRAWARSAPSPIPQDVEKTEELARKARELEKADNKATMLSQDLAAERALADLDSLAARLGLNRTSPELVKIAHEGVSILEPPVLHSAILCSSLGCAGSVRVVPSGIPAPTLGNMNNLTSSVTGAGSVTLWENNWFGGRRTFIFTVAVCISMIPLNFDNIASSAIAV
jgi:hypothetical protein